MHNYHMSLIQYNQIDGFLNNNKHNIELENTPNTNIHESINDDKLIDDNSMSGGARANKNGQEFEELTDLKNKYISTRPHPKNNSFKRIKFYGFQKEYTVLRQYDFRKYLNAFYCLNLLEDDFPHGCKRPDEAYVDEENNIIFFTEKKSQKTKGSVIEILQTAEWKTEQLTKIIPQFKIVYIYCLSEWIARKGKHEVAALKNKNFPVFITSGETHKDELIKFMIEFPVDKLIDK